MASEQGTIHAGNFSRQIASGVIAQVGLATVAKLYAEDVTQATSSCAVINAVQEGLGCGIELVGGVWGLLLSAALFHSTLTSQALAVFGGVVGLAGVLTVVPQLDGMKELFGLRQIIGFVWVGIWMLRRS